ncbi:MAG TPA: septum formation family protein [Candidatus Limnocylindrales bacterium]|jgi:hypothetical protein|nr:septum formation family protein [Candidatus Limnocylindrales bacterium]
MNSLIVRIGLVALIAGGGFLLRDRLTGNVTGLQVGDCFDLPSDSLASQVEDVQHHPCTEPHDYEAFAEFGYPVATEADYPGERALERWADERCAEGFATYVGIPIERSGLTFYFFTPTREGWGRGDRVVNCVLATDPVVKQSVSLKGSAR